MLKATNGAAWLAVRLGAGARTNCPPTPGGNANKHERRHMLVEINN